MGRAAYRGDALTGRRHIDRGDAERTDGLAERSDLEHVLLALELEGFAADHEGEGGQIAHLRPRACLLYTSPSPRD